MNKLAACKVLRLKINSLVAVIAPNVIHKMMFIAPHKNYITTHQARYTIIAISVLWLAQIGCLCVFLDAYTLCLEFICLNET